MKYRKKPVVIEAVQWQGESNLDEALAFVGQQREPGVKGYGAIIIPTLEGDMSALPGDWIIRGVQGEHYPCKPDIFAATYERVTEDDEQEEQG